MQAPRSSASSSEVRAADVEAVAVCLLFSYLDPTHERVLAGRLREELPDLHVSASHEVLAKFREYERCSTTVIDAYLSPLLDRYLARLAAAARERSLPEPSVMLSSGGLAPLAEAARAGVWSVLSGPAGGAVGAGLLARASADGNALGFDMGGTSCDVCVIENGNARPHRLAPDRRPRRSSCRWSTSTPSAPVVARSAGATAAARFGSGRDRRGPSRVRPAIGAAAASRR